MCSSVRKLRHNLQLKVGAQSATNWRHALMADLSKGNYYPGWVQCVGKYIISHFYRERSFQMIWIRRVNRLSGC